MPWLEDTQPGSASSVVQWQLALKNAFRRRVPTGQLEGLLRKLDSRYHAPPESIARTLLGFRAQKRGADDPLLFTYSNLLLQINIIGAKDLLNAPLDTSLFARAPDSDGIEGPSAGFPACEERIFGMLTQSFMTQQTAIKPTELHGIIHALTRWMHVVNKYEMRQRLNSDALHPIPIGSIAMSMYEALAWLVVTVLSNPAFKTVTKQRWWQKRRAVLIRELITYDTNVLQWMQSHLSGRLQALTTLSPFFDTDEDGLPAFSNAQISQSVQDLPTSNSRMGLYIWLNACLYSRPYTDTSSMIMYLQARYSEDLQSLVVDLLSAGFDVLTNELCRKHGEHDVNVIRSFIINKLPMLLSNFSGTVTPAATIEAYVQMAFSSIAMDALPPISAGATEVRDKLKATRLDFLRASHIHAVLSELTVTAILGEHPTPVNAARYTKEVLVSKYASNIHGLNALIEELEGTSYNAAAISGCILSMITTFSLNRDTASLKSICTALTKRLASVDIMLQHCELSSLLLPLCTLLNTWTHDQDQMEFTPSYEEFAAVLLLVFAVVHRYGLHAGDIGLEDDDSFVTKMIREISSSKLPGDLTEEQNEQLSGWIEGLYATDDQGETAGISDDIMRPCPPQAFYQLVPTLFEQSVTACKAGALSLKAFKGGLELLVEPFLLPSLVGGLSWIVKQSWEDHNDAEVLLQVLDKLLKPSSTSQETNSMHKVILGIVADPLYYSLHSLDQRMPGKKDVGPLMEVLRPYLARDRTAYGSEMELQAWMSTANGGISRCLRDTIQHHIAWMTNVGPSPPPSYTHSLVVTSCETLGVAAVLDSMIAELRAQTDRGNGSIALDACTAIICAPPVRSTAPLMVPSTTSSQFCKPSITFREALRLRSSNLQDLLSMPSADAEALIRLARRVESQLEVTHIPQMTLPLPDPTADQATDQIMVELGLTDASMVVSGQPTAIDAAATLDTSAAAAFSDADLQAAFAQPMAIGDEHMINMRVDPNAMPADSSMDIFGDLDLSVDPSFAQLQSNGVVDGNLDQSMDDDIFAGLDMGNLDYGNFT